METFWDKRSVRYDDNIKKHDALYERTIERTRALLNDSDVVLDVGCASGEQSLDIAPYVRRVHGIDSSVKMIELARAKARDRRADNIAFDPMDAEDPGLQDGSFSAVVAFNILHLLGNARGTLARLHDLLTDGGTLISKTPCLGERGWLLRKLIGLAQRLGLVPAVRSFTVAELETLVSDGGFEIVETDVFEEQSAIQWIVARRARQGRGGESERAAAKKARR